MKKILAHLLAGVFLFPSAHANTPGQPYSAEALEAAKKEAKSIGAASGKTVAIDANGQIVLDSNGNPVLQPNSIQSMQGGLELFKSTTGLAGVEPEKINPRGGSAAVVKLNQMADFSCKVLPGRKPILSMGPLAFRVEECQYSGSSVKSVRFSVCDAPAKGGACGSDDFTPLNSPVSAGAYSSVGSAQMGLGCNNELACRLTLEGSWRIGGSADEIRNNTAAAAAQSNLTQGFVNVASSGRVAAEFESTGRDLVNCQTKSNGADGVYQTCDGSQQIKISTKADSPQCSAENVTRTCEQESVLVSNFTKSCLRTFPVTVKSSFYELKDTLTCDVIRRDEDGTVTVDNQCTSGSAGKTLVGNTQEECIEKKVIKVPGPQPGQTVDREICVAWKHTEYWINLENKNFISHTEFPSPVGGACDTRINSETRLELCEGEWFGRLLDDSECKIMATSDTGDTMLVDVNYAYKEGCGACTKPRIQETCYAVANPTPSEEENDADSADSCASLDLTGCTFSGATPVQLSDPNGGLVIMQRETYSCTTQVRQCVKWSTTNSDPNCINADLTQGTNKLAPDPSNSAESFNNAMVAAALLDGTAKAAEGEQANQKVPLIFGGTDMRCSRPVNLVGSAIQKNCCRQDLYRPKKGFLTQKGCSLREAELAAARRSRYAHYIGDYCSKRLPIVKTCIRRTQTYCVFQGILPRLVAEQGREQLQKMLSSGQGPAQQQSVTFSYHSSTNTGTWTAPVSVNGSTISAWQWPQYCANPEEAAKAYIENPDASACPGFVQTWFAVCEKPAGCGPLPASPEEGSLDWTLRVADSLQNVTTALGRFAVTTGACSPSSGQCTYTHKAWPAGQGGRVVVTKDLSWTLFAGDTQTSQGGVDPNDYQLNNIGDLMFKLYPVSGTAGGSMPSSINVGFSRDGGQSWQSLSIPTTAIASQEMPLPGTEVTITGSCDPYANMCSYRVTGSVTVQSKDWGTPKNPDCSGFTAGQLAVLDFAAMDLKEWLDSVMQKVGSNNPAALAGKAAEQFQAYNKIFNGGAGQVTAAAPVSANFARVVPAEGFGPFNVRLAVSGYWPEYSAEPAQNVERVTSVSVDWGDCSPVEILQPVPPSEGVGFRGIHQYEKPDADKHSCLKNGAGDNLERNIIHRIKITATTVKDGVSTTRVREISVENAWAQFPGANSNNSFVEQTKTVSPLNGNPPPQNSLNTLVGN